VPDRVLPEADRLESLFFDGYDPYFEGDDSRPLDRKGQSGAQQSQDKARLASSVLPFGIAEPRSTMTVVHRVTAAELLQCAYFDPSYGFNKLATIDVGPARRRIRVLSVTCPARCGD
jgi:hypothetical protein